MDTNSVVIIGNMVKDIETKSVGEHTAGTFTIAVSGMKKDEVSYFEVKVWNKLADLMAQYTQKGSKVCVIGRLNQDRWEKDGQKQSRVIIQASGVQFLTPKNSGENRTEKQASKPAADFTPEIDDNPFSDEDIPF